MKPTFPAMPNPRLFLALVAIGASVTLPAGCGTRSTAPASGRVLAATVCSAPLGDAALPLGVSRERLTELLVDGFRKPIMGRTTSPANVARVADQMGPIIAKAARQPQVQGTFRQMAHDEGLTVADARTRWIRLQEADILLESGGDPDAVSVAGAVGVAQWTAGAGGHGTLPVDLVASQRLTRQIDPLKTGIAWLVYRQRSDARPVGPTPLSAAQATAALPALRAQLERLRAVRRRVDARYDPPQALYAQTRYLLNLYPRFPSADWLFQAYHGGEAGVQRTLSRYLGPAWPGSSTAAIRFGQAGRPLSFEDVYWGATPRSHAAAFSYLYGRGDDHRHYWWKLRAARNAIALYRRDRNAFTTQWAALLPGRPLDALWYPNGPSEAFGDTGARQAARTEGRLLPVGDGPALLVRPGARPDAALRPEAKGALLLTASIYKRVGGWGQIPVGDMTLTQTDLARRAALPPSKPVPGPLLPPPLPGPLPGGGPPPDFDYHVTGLAFDLQRPHTAPQRKTLEYALGYLRDRQIIWWRDETDAAGLHYHVVPNPRYGLALARIGRTGAVPPLPAL